MAVVGDRGRSLWFTPLVAVVFVLVAATVAVVGVIGPGGPVISAVTTGVAPVGEHTSTVYDYDALGVARAVAGVRPPADGAVSPALSGEGGTPVDAVAAGDATPTSSLLSYTPNAPRAATPGSRSSRR